MPRAVTESTVQTTVNNAIQELRGSFQARENELQAQIAELKAAQNNQNASQNGQIVDKDKILKRISDPKRFTAVGRGDHRAFSALEEELKRWLHKTGLTRKGRKTVRFDPALEYAKPQWKSTPTAEASAIEHALDATESDNEESLPQPPDMSPSNPAIVAYSRGLFACALNLLVLAAVMSTDGTSEKYFAFLNKTSDPDTLPSLDCPSATQP